MACALVALTGHRAVSAGFVDGTTPGGSLSAPAGAADVSPKRLLDESPWLQFTSEWQRFEIPPRLTK
jgi:hypothetical protein